MICCAFLWCTDRSKAPLLDKAGDGVTGAVVTDATVSGGGDLCESNRVTDNFCFVGGGSDNQAGNADADPTSAKFATVSGGQGNTAGGPNVVGQEPGDATIGGRPPPLSRASGRGSFVDQLGGCGCLLLRRYLSETPP